MKLFGLIMVVCSEAQTDDMIGKYFDACDEHVVAVYDELGDCDSMALALAKLPTDVVPYVDCEDVSSDAQQTRND